MPASRRKSTSSRSTTRSTSSRASGSRSTTRKKRTTKAERERQASGRFWRQMCAVLMLAAALFLVFTWFGHGGNVLNEIHAGIYAALGFATYIFPFLLVYLAVQIFRAENNRLPATVFVFSVLMFLWIAGIAAITETGGMVGSWLNGLMINILDQNVVIFIYILLIFVTLAFILELSPAALFKKIAKAPVKADEDVSTTPERAPKQPKLKAVPGPAKNQLDIKVNAGSTDDASDDEEDKKKKPKFSFLHKPPRINQMPAEPDSLEPADAAMDPESAALAAGSAILAGAASNATATTMPDSVNATNVAGTGLNTDASGSNDSKPAKDADYEFDHFKWKTPSTSLLTRKQQREDPGNVKQNAFIIQKTFAEFGINVEMEDANIGPRITQYTLKAPGGVNLSKIAARDKELAYNLGATTVRIEAPIPGTQLIGVEVPNVRSASVSLKNLIESPEWKSAKGQLTFAVGKDISGKPVVADLADMRHLLIAGTTGSGKSVMTNTIIMSLLYRNTPADMRMIIVDPKHVEMVAYNDIPHLLTPIINDTTKALSAMKWAVNEMDRRYAVMAEEKVKKITDYNDKMAARRAAGDESAKKMPYIVIVIDEMSDLMMQASKELEPLIVRISQLGRAAGMHLILATQKPIVKVITGLIKGNIPSRIAFRVLSYMESRIILDVSGAEKLLGQGDMLLSTEQTSNGPARVQGAWTPDEDIDKVTDFLRGQHSPHYIEEITNQQVSFKGMPGGEVGGMDGLGRKFDPKDPLVRKAVEICITKGKFSTSLLQTYLSKSHGFVSGLGVWLEEIGAIGPANGNKPRDILIQSMEEFDKLTGEGMEV